MKHASRERTAKKGFTLIEIIIAIAIVGILAATGIGVFRYLDSAKKTKTIGLLSSLKTDIEFYQAQVGKYPTTLEDLIHKPKDVPAIKWERRLDSDTIPVDGWGNEIQYQLTPGKAHKYELYSYGKNGEDAPEEEHYSVWDLNK